MAQPNNI